MASDIPYSYSAPSLLPILASMLMPLVFFASCHSLQIGRQSLGKILLISKDVLQQY